MSARKDGESVKKPAYSHLRLCFLAALAGVLAAACSAGPVAPPDSAGPQAESESGRETPNASETETESGRETQSDSEAETESGRVWHEVRGGSSEIEIWAESFAARFLRDSPMPGGWHHTHTQQGGQPFHLYTEFGTHAAMLRPDSLALEFVAVDAPLGRDAEEALRRLADALFLAREDFSAVGFRVQSAIISEGADELCKRATDRREGRPRRAGPLERR